jgi:redox-sensitive bicupin YhaK (pirin superfamily)
MAPRSVAQRFQRRPGHKIINRMFSPGDMGRSLKPFVFLDFLHGNVEKNGLNFGMHPHSGQQTLTYSNAPVHYTDTEGQQGLLPPGGLEYMNPGGGAWHNSSFKGAIDGLRAFQFWFASPPGVEDGPSESIFLDPKDVPKGNNFKLLMGEYGGLKSPFPNYSHVNVLDVTLAKSGDSFVYRYPLDHDTSFVFVYQGAGLVADDEHESSPADIFVMDSHGDSVEVKATKDNSRFIMASAVPHKYSLSLGMYSVHTNPESLAKGEARINQIGDRLAREGKLG